MNQAVVAVVEFGATARGDADAHSDRDICVIVEDMEEESIQGIRSEVAAVHSTDPASVSCYTTSSLDQMVARGSLFLWHLKLEGRVLSDEDGVLDAALASLPPYEDYDADLDRFRAVFGDVRTEFAESGTLNTFEQHVLFVVLRNVCMLLTVHAGRPAFGRSVVVKHAKAIYPALPVSDEVVTVLTLGHLAFMRNSPVDVPALLPPALCIQVLGDIQSLLLFSEAKCG